MRRILPILLICFPFLINAQQTITGRVTDSLNRPVNGAIVRVGTDHSGLSNEEGLFRLSGIPTGTKGIKISCVGYRSYSSDSIIASADQFYAIVLSINETELKSVVVSARKPIIQQLIDMTVMNVDARMLKETSTALDILKLAPGIMVGDNEDAVSLSGKDAVQLMLNGRIAHLSTRDLLKLLKATPASGISKIEIITNPSSRFDVKGNTGILNIWMKKNQPGFNGNMNSSISSGQYQMGDESLNLTYGHGKLSLQSYSAYHFGKYRSTQNEKRFINNITQEKTGESVEQWSDPVWRLQADLTLNPKHVLGALIEMEKSSNHGYDNAGIIAADTSFIAANRTPATRKWNTYNLNYQYKDTLGHELNMDLDRSYFKKDMRVIQNNKAVAGAYEKFFDEGSTTTNQILDILTFKTDYTQSFKTTGIRLETGIKLSTVDAKHDFGTGTYKSGQFRIDSMISNNFHYIEKVEAAYANIAKNYKKWGWQIGLRIEQSKVKGLLTKTNGQTTDLPDSSYFNWLPSFFIRYSPNPKHAFRFSTGKRITRPDYEDLRPFEYSENAFLVKKGNPSLAPQTNFNSEFTYTYKNNTSFTASFDHTQNYFTTVNYGVGQKLFEMVKNAGIANDLSFSFNHRQKIKAWYSANLHVDIFCNQFKGRVLTDDIDVARWGFSASASQRFTLPKNYMLSLSARYSSSSQHLIFENSSNASIGLSCNKNFNNDRGNIRVGISDIFRMQKNNITVNTTSLSFVQQNRWESRRVFIDFSWHFGNKNKTELRERETGNSDERRRSGN